MVPSLHEHKAPLLHQHLTVFPYIVLLAHPTPPSPMPNSCRAGVSIPWWLEALYWALHKNTSSTASISYLSANDFNDTLSSVITILDRLLPISALAFNLRTWISPLRECNISEHMWFLEGTGLDLNPKTSSAVLLCPLGLVQFYKVCVIILRDIRDNFILCCMYCLYKSHL